MSHLQIIIRLFILAHIRIGRHHRVGTGAAALKPGCRGTLPYDHALIDGGILYTESHMTASRHNDRHDTKDQPWQHFPNKNASVSSDIASAQVAGTALAMAFVLPFLIIPFEMIDDIVFHHEASKKRA